MSSLDLVSLTDLSELDTTVQGSLRGPPTHAVLFWIRGSIDGDPDDLNPVRSFEFLEVL